MKMFLESIFIFICFSMFPSEKVKNKKFLKILKRITNYTAGIYYIHETLFGYCKNYFIIFGKYTIIQDISLCIERIKYYIYLEYKFISDKYKN